MPEIKLFRKRLIPEECILLKDDEIIYSDDRIIVTRWKTIRPKKNFDHGASCYFLKEGYKVSSFLKPDGRLLYWYCDIVDYEYLKEDNSYIFRDLLADVLVYPDDFVKVLDLDEVGDAIDKGLINTDDIKRALSSLSSLLDMIYSGQFDQLTQEITSRVMDEIITDQKNKYH